MVWEEGALYWLAGRMVWEEGALVGASVGFGSWTIFDFPIMSRLQRWYLNETLGTLEVNGGGGYDTVSNLEPLDVKILIWKHFNEEKYSDLDP